MRRFILWFSIATGPACSSHADQWEFSASGQGMVRCACSPTATPGQLVEHPSWAEAEWAHQRNVRIVVEAAVTPDAGVRR